MSSSQSNNLIGNTGKGFYEINNTPNLSKNDNHTNNNLPHAQFNANSVNTYNREGHFDNMVQNTFSNLKQDFNYNDQLKNDSSTGLMQSQTNRNSKNDTQYPNPLNIGNSNVQQSFQPANNKMPPFLNSVNLPPLGGLYNSNNMTQSEDSKLSGPPAF